jgi:hypothetical protein
LRQVPEIQLELRGLAILAGDGEAGAVSEALGGNVQRQFRGGGFGGHRDGSHQALPFGAGAEGQGALEFGGAGGVHAESAQKRLLGFHGGVVIAAPDVPEARLDSTDGSGAVQQLFKRLGWHGETGNLDSSEG